MAGRMIVDVDLEHSQTGLDLKTISYLNRILLDISQSNFTQCLKFCQENVDRFLIYCVCDRLKNLESIISLLDSGATKVFLGHLQFAAIVEERLLVGQDLDRIVVTLREWHGKGNVKEIVKPVEEIVQALAPPATIGIHFEDETWLKTSDATQQKFHNGGIFSDCYVSLRPSDEDHFARLVKSGHVIIVHANDITKDPKQYTTRLPVHSLITSVLHSGRPDGLFSTIVTDERGICLGLVYSNEKSIETALQLGRGVYHSRRHGLWIKGQESGNTQELVRIAIDCDGDALQFIVRQKGEGFCHLKTSTCFGPYTGLSRLQGTLEKRRESAPPGSYTARLFNEPKFLEAKILEEASELCEATKQNDIAAEAADLLYFALTKCVASNVNLEDIERNLDSKSLKVTRRKGAPKTQWAKKVGLQTAAKGTDAAPNGIIDKETVKEAASIPKSEDDPSGLQNGKIQMRRYKTASTDPETIKDALQRPSQRSTEQIMNIVNPIVREIREGGDAAVLKYTHKFEKATSLTSPVLSAPFPPKLMQLPPETIEAIDISYENIAKFHAAQREEKPLQVETMPGVVCSRFSRPIERVGLYVPGGTAVLPSTALMLGVPAKVAGCKKIVLASPPRSNGTITPEIVYVAHKVGAESIVLAGGAQAVAAMAYGTPSISKVDKILGPGNQFVTAAKMIVANDTMAGVSIDMPAGPSEVLVIADKAANPAFVASDLLSQAEHGTDSQVVLIAVDLDEEQLGRIEDELHAQANALPRKDIVRGAIEHSVTLTVKDIDEAMKYSNQYAPEHLILQVENAESVVNMVENAGSVFVGPWTPESVGDYSAGVNHSLPTYGYARQYSGVNLSSFTKHITSSQLTRQGLENVGGAVMELARVEELEAHRRAVSIRLAEMDAGSKGNGST